MQRTSLTRMDIKMDFKTWHDPIYPTLLPHLIQLKLDELVDNCKRLNELIQFLDKYAIVFKLKLNFFREADHLFKKIIAGIKPLAIPDEIKEAISKLDDELNTKLVVLFKHNQPVSSMAAKLPTELFSNIANSLTLHSTENLLSTCGYFSHQHPLHVLKKQKIYPKWQIAVGATHTVILDQETGRLYGVGANDKSQLGFDFRGKIVYHQPTLIPIAEKVKEVAIGYNHTLALCDRDVYGFGNNSSSQLGLGEEFIKNEWQTNIIEPMKIKLPKNEIPKKIATSSDHKGYSLIFCESQNLYIFGDNDKGQLGLGDRIQHFTPTIHPFTPKLAIKEMLVGARHTFLITEDGIYGFGDNLCGQLGLEQEIVFQPVPTRINFEKFGIHPIQIATGDFHTLILDQSGKVFGFGANGCSQLGLPYGTFYFTPHLIHIPGTATQIKAKIGTSFVFCGDQVYAFGDNNYGQLGIGKKSLTSSNPQLLNLNIKLFDIMPGGYHSFIYCDDKNFYATGSNCCAQLGIGSQGQVEYTPKLTNMFKDIQKLSRQEERSELENNNVRTLYRPH